MENLQQLQHHLQSTLNPKSPPPHDSSPITLSPHCIIHSRLSFPSPSPLPPTLSYHFHFIQHPPLWLRLPVPGLPRNAMCGALRCATGSPSALLRWSSSRPLPQRRSCCLRPSRPTSWRSSSSRASITTRAGRYDRTKPLRVGGGGGGGRGGRGVGEGDRGE